jgi:hypothetical protein
VLVAVDDWVAVLVPVDVSLLVLVLVPELVAV